MKMFSWLLSLLFKKKTEKVAEHLYFGSHVYNDVGKFPCPMPGCEDGLVLAHSPEGLPAWWVNGHLYVWDENNLSIFPSWIADIPKPTPDN